MANNWAVIIGINYYQRHPERRLKYAVHDAQLMYDFLCNHARFSKDHLILCLGDEAHRDSPYYPLCSNLLGLLTQDLHPSRISKVDRFWFFFAGHGISRNGRDYLMTSDSLIGDIDLRIALPLEEIIACLRQHQDADIVLILDSCRQIVGSRDLGDTGTVGEETIKLAQGSGITTIFSCDYGQLSHELDSKKHGAFTYTFVEGLQQCTLPSQLEIYLQKYVPELNVKNGKSSKQTPRIRVESISRAHQSLLPDCATKVDIDELIRIAKSAEIEDNFEYARNFWWSVIRVSRSEIEIREAKKAIERIEAKSNKAQASLSTLSRGDINGKKNQLKPIQSSMQTFKDINPDDWSIKSRNGSQSFWNKVINFLFEEKDF